MSRTRVKLGNFGKNIKGNQFIGVVFPFVSFIFDL